MTNRDDVVHTETLRGYRIDIIRDGDVPTPRDDCQNGVMIVRESRDHLAPDETAWRSIEGRVLYFPPTVKCSRCDGPSDSDACSECDGDGTREALTWGEVVAWATAEHGATTVLPLDGPNDWAGRYIDMSDPATGLSAHWTDPACELDLIDGAIFDTAERREETGTTAEQMVQALRGELTEYNAWADGEVYGYAITDCNGEVIPDGSVWGFYDIDETGKAGDGTGYPLDEARDAVPDEPCVKLHAVRLSASDWSAVLGALGCLHASNVNELAARIAAQVPAETEATLGALQGA